MNLHQPLEPSQSTQHGNTDWQTVPQSTEANLAVYARHSGHCTLASYPSSATHPANPKNNRTDIPFRSAFNLLTITSAG